MFLHKTQPHEWTMISHFIYLKRPKHLMTKRTTHIKDHSTFLCPSPTNLFSCLSAFLKRLGISNFSSSLKCIRLSFHRGKQSYGWGCKFTYPIKCQNDRGFNGSNVISPSYTAGHSGPGLMWDLHDVRDPNYLHLFAQILSTSHGPRPLTAAPAKPSTL